MINLTERIFTYLVVFLVGEVVAFFVFYILNRSFTGESSVDISSVLRGVLERFVLFLGLLNNYPQIIIAFGALKIGTRIQYKDAEENKENIAISNNYFLSGNLISLGFVMIVVTVAEYICAVSQKGIQV